MNGVKILMLVISHFPCILFAQDYLSFEEEKRIKFSDDYYWAESSDFSLKQATIQAMDCLVEKVIGDAVYQAVEKNEMLEELGLRVNKARIKQEGKNHIMVWIAKDSVSITMQKNSEDPNNQQTERPLQKDDDKHVEHDNPDLDLAIEALKSCKNYKEVNRVTRQYGFIRGEFNSSKGFDHPEQCIIAVFSADHSLVALLDKGSSSRVDLLKDQVINNPETFYGKNKDYKLWYLQQ